MFNYRDLCLVYLKLLFTCPAKGGKFRLIWNTFYVLTQFLNKNMNPLYYIDTSSTDLKCSRCCQINK